jgi:hypothetical protein
MASHKDTQNRKLGSSEAEITHNHSVAKSQVDKTRFRAQKVSESADPFVSGKLPIQADRY